MKRRREGAESRFTTFVEGLTSVIGHADRAKPLHDYLHRVGDAVRTQECPADGGGDGACAGWGAASVLDHDGLVDSDREVHKAKPDPDLRRPDQPSGNVYLAARQEVSAPRIECR